MDLIKKEPLTFISLGSGGLLTEFFISKQLNKAGFDNLRWRLIDPCYMKEGYEDSIKSFEEEIGGDVQVFPTELAYLSEAKTGADPLASEDVNLGTNVLLFIDPPTPLAISSNKSQISPSEYMRILGIPIEEQEIKKANCIYLVTLSQSDKEELIKLQKALAEGNMGAADGVLKCQVDTYGNFKLTSNPSEKGKIIERYFNQELKKVEEIAKKTKCSIKIEQLNKLADTICKNLNDSGKVASIKILVTNFDISEENLCNFFSNSTKPMLIASLKENRSSFNERLS